VELDGGAPRAPLREALEAAQVGDGEFLQASAVAVDGELSIPWRGGQPRLDEPVAGSVSVSVDALRLPALTPGGLELTSTSASADVDGVLGAGLSSDGLALASTVDTLRSGPATLSGLELGAATDDGALRIDGLTATLTAPGLEELPVQLAGRIELGGEEIGPGGKIRVDVGGVDAGLALAAEAVLDGGALRIDVPRLAVAPGLESGRLRASGELAQWARLPGLAALATSASGAEPEGPLDVEFELTGVDGGGLESFAVALGLRAEGAAAWPEASGSARGAVRLDPGAPAAAAATLTLVELRYLLRGQELVTEQPVELHLADGRLRLPPARLRLGAHELEASADVELDRGWRLGSAPSALVETFEAEARGALDARLIGSQLPDCRAAGVLDFEAWASGDGSAPSARVEIRDGGGAAFTWDRPYVTRFAAPSASLRLDAGQLVIEGAGATLNEGELAVTGSVGGESFGEAIDISATLADVRYRLDYGLTVELGGTARYASRPQPGKLEAALVIDRGTLRRRIDAGRELLEALLAPPALEAGVTSSAFGETELDIRVATEDGVRVRNNLADMRIGWAPLQVEGTVAAPRISGSLEVDPDGRVYAYGQVIRLDRAALVFPGVPSVAPRLDLQVTTSLEDPSLLTPEDQRVLADLAQGGGTGGGLDSTGSGTGDRVASGLTTYLGDQLASRLGRVLGRTQLRYRPLWIFGEADPEARLVVSRDLSRYASVGVAFDLRQADAQTYLLEVGRLPRLPRLTGTFFSNDDAQLGATVQQQINFGGGESRDREAGVDVRDVRVECAKCDADSGRGGIREIARRAVEWRRGKRVDLDASFDLEVDIAERLRRKGYPGAQPRVELLPSGEGVDIDVSLDPVPRVGFEWLGEKPPPSRRRTLESLYRSDYSERAALDEIRETAERVWRSRGHPWPRVAVWIEAEDGDGGGGANAGANGSADDGAGATVAAGDSGVRTVVIESEPGEEYELAPARFSGVPADVEATLQGRFASQQLRSELVAGIDDADQRVVEALRILGFPRSRVIGRAFDPETLEPTIYVEAGARRRISRVEMEGAPAGEGDRLRGLLPLQPGQPVIDGDVVSAAFAVEKDLRDRGYTQAKVRLLMGPPPEAGGRGG
ncbi:MAG: translocation/assembly module TamB domain-containing protein, partial [Acidobacteriota bacterium]